MKTILVAACLALAACSSTQAEWAAVYDKANDGDPNAKAQVELIERGLIQSCPGGYSAPGGMRVRSGDGYGNYCMEVFGSEDNRSHLLVTYWSDGVNMYDRLVRHATVRAFNGTGWTIFAGFYDDVGYQGDQRGAFSCNGQIVELNLNYQGNGPGQWGGVVSWTFLQQNWPFPMC